MTSTNSSHNHSAITPRNTKQRRIVAALMAAETEFVTAQQVHGLLRANGETVGLATVYRALQAMADTHELDTIRNSDGETAYRQCSPQHHHHLICRNCGKAIEVELPGFEDWAVKTAKENGFRDPDHVIEIYGTCSDC